MNPALQLFATRAISREDGMSPLRNFLIVDPEPAACANLPLIRL